MAITYTGQDGFAVRLGTIISELNRTVAGFGTDLNTYVDAIASGYRSNDQIVTDTLFSTRDAYRGVHSSYLGALQTIAQNTAIEQSNRDTPLAAKTLLNAVKAIRADMVANSQSFKRPTLGTTVTAGSGNNGNTVLGVSTTNNLGDPLDMVMAETLTITCTNDVDTGGTQFGEALSVAGQPLKSVFDYQWPGGSGATGSFTVTDAAVNGIVTDGSFESWGGTGNNTPTYWVTSGSGTYGTNILRDTSVVRGNYAAQLSSVGSVTTRLKQELTTLEPATVYAFNAWMKVSASDGSGVVRVRLMDGTGTTIADNAGTDNSYTRDISSQIGTSYTQVTVYFRTPKQLPDQVFLEFGFSTAPSGTRTLNVDLLTLVKAVQLYSGGPYAAAFSKDDATTKDDFWTAAVTNSLGTDSFVRSFDRVYGMRQLGQYFVTATSPTLADTLIPA